MKITVVNNSEGHPVLIRLMGVELPVLGAGVVSGPGETNLVVSFKDAELTFEDLPFPSLIGSSAST
jgi:hypothetical protein